MLTVRPHARIRDLLGKVTVRPHTRITKCPFCYKKRENMPIFDSPYTCKGNYKRKTSSYRLIASEVKKNALCYFQRVYISIQ